MVVIALAAAGLAACQFNPGGGAGGDGNVGGGGPDGDTPDPDAQPGTPDADTGPVECTPGETVCAGRSLNMCNDAGDGYATTVVCPFTCEADDHCTLASNLPQADQEACTGGAQLTPPAGAVISIEDSGDGRIECDPHCGDGATTEIDAAGAIDEGQQHVAWFCLSEVDIPAGVTVTATDGLSHSIVFLVTGAASVAGTIALDGGDATRDLRGEGGAGGAPGAARSGQAGQAGGGNCGGQGGQKAEEEPGPPPGDTTGGGGGGGGYSAGGGTGGEGRNEDSIIAAGGVAGPSCGEGGLDPLIGGSGGGGGGDGTCNGDCGWPGGGGGGALQISAAAGVTITGTINASGGNGFGSTTGDDGRGGGGGGGAGGAILVEGPALSIDSGALLVEGGAGGGALAGGGAGGGAGGAPGGGSGADADEDSEGGAGAGGGGGRVRLNATATPACSGPVSSPEGACAPGGLRRGGGIGGQ